MVEKLIGKLQDEEVEDAAPLADTPATPTEAAEQLTPDVREQLERAQVIGTERLVRNIARDAGIELTQTGVFRAVDIARAEGISTRSGVISALERVKANQARAAARSGVHERPVAPWMRARTKDAAAEMVREATKKPFETRAEFVIESYEASEKMMQLKKAYILQQTEAEIATDVTMLVECADGRSSPARAFTGGKDSHFMFAQEYFPMAGNLLLRGVKQLHSIEELDRFYDGTGDLLCEEDGTPIPNRVAINHIFHSMFTRRIRSKFALWEELASRPNSTPAESEILRSKVFSIELRSHSSSSGYIETLDYLKYAAAPDVPQPIEELLPSIPVAEHEKFLDFMRGSATGCCGAHKHDTEQALEETAKEAYLLKRWLHDTHVLQKTGEQRDNFTAEELARIEIIRTHHFTDEGAVRLSTTLDTRALKPVVTTQADGRKTQSAVISRLPTDILAAVGPCTPVSWEWADYQLELQNEILPHDPFEHSEQRVVISNAPLAHMMEGRSDLKHSYTADRIHTNSVYDILVGIARREFGARNPGKPIGIILDFGEEPNEDYSEVEFGSSPEAKTLAERLMKHDDDSSIAAIDAVKAVVPSAPGSWQKKFLLQYKRTPISSAEELVRLRENARFQNKREDLYAHAVEGNVDGALQIIRRRTNTRNLAPTFDDPQDRETIRAYLEAKRRSGEATEPLLTPIQPTEED